MDFTRCIAREFVHLSYTWFCNPIAVPDGRASMAALDLGANEIVGAELENIASRWNCLSKVDAVAESQLADERECYREVFLF